MVSIILHCLHTKIATSREEFIFWICLIILQYLNLCVSQLKSNLLCSAICKPELINLILGEFIPTFESKFPITAILRGICSLFTFGTNKRNVHVHIIIRFYPWSHVVIYELLCIHHYTKQFIMVKYTGAVATSQRIIQNQ